MEGGERNKRVKIHSGRGLAIQVKVKTRGKRNTSGSVLRDQVAGGK